MSSAPYRFTVPPTAEQGSHAGTCRANGSETYRQNALWDYNSARAHDGLPPLARMPAGTRYERLATERGVNRLMSQLASALGSMKLPRCT